MRTAAVDVPRMGSAGWLFDGGSTNLALYSESFDNAVWDKLSSGDGLAPVVTHSAGISPDGTMTAARIVFNSGSDNASNYSLLRDIINVSDPTLSIWVKSYSGVEQSIQLHFSGNSGPSITVSDEWVRIKVSDAFVGAGSYGLQLRGGSGNIANTSDILVWGAQVENLPFATSYIATLSAPVTCAPDNVSFSTLGNFREREGCVFLRADVIGSASTEQYILDISDGTSANRIVLYRNSSGFIFLIINTGGVAQVSSNTGVTMSQGTQYEIAINYRANGVDVFVDGVSVIVDNSVIMPTGLSLSSVGQNYGGAGALFGHIHDLRFYDDNLTLDEIKLLGGK